MARSIVGSIARLALGIVTASAPVVTDTIWHHELTGRDGQAGAIRHYEHSICDGLSAEVAESFGFPAGSVAGSSIVQAITALRAVMA